MSVFNKKEVRQAEIDPRAIGILISGNDDTGLHKQVADMLGKIALEATRAGNTQIATEAVRKLGEVGIVNATISNCTVSNIGR